MSKNKNDYRIIGLMSGTSLDGLDVACCRLIWKRKWTFKIETAQTVAYPARWRFRLANAHLLDGADLIQLDADYGHYIGGCVGKFIRRHRLQGIDAIASHGHTIFHQPRRGFTFQIGHGAAIHAMTGLPVVYDFRSLDVMLGGEGAPLVPIGDRLLFSGYDYCLNLGGIANISMERNGKWIAYDLAFANMGLNFLAQKAGKPYDRDGRMADKGSIHEGLLQKLNLAYRPFLKRRPSLGREIFDAAFAPLLDDHSILLEDRMHTLCVSIASQVARALPPSDTPKRLLVTGGGALNPVVIKLLRDKLKTGAKLEIPSLELIHFKEALIFAFLGVLRMRREINALSYVTHARRDSSTGSIIG